jgi:hypothetical protein
MTDGILHHLEYALEDLDFLLDYIEKMEKALELACEYMVENISWTESTPSGKSMDTPYEFNCQCWKKLAGIE